MEAEFQAGVRVEAEDARALVISEMTSVGEQFLVCGVGPLRLGDQLALRAAAPLFPAKPQKPLDIGLFDLAARNQLELFG